MSSTHVAATTTALIAVSLLVQGCMSDQAFEGAWDSGSADDTGAPVFDSGHDTGDEDQPDPAWWSLEVTALMEDGQPVQSDTTLVISLIDASADPANPICQASYPQPEISVEDPPDSSIFHWWQISLGEPSTDCSGHALEHVPATLSLGIGALHPDIAALLEPAGYDEIEAYLYGTYLGTDDVQTIWTYGIAATAAGWAAEQLPVTEPPIPDGTYSLVPVYLLPLQGG